jgi:hypothetical protein
MKWSPASAKWVGRFTLEQVPRRSGSGGSLRDLLANPPQKSVVDFGHQTCCTTNGRSTMSDSNVQPIKGGKPPRARKRLEMPRHVERALHEHQGRIYSARAVVLLAIAKIDDTVLLPSTTNYFGALRPSSSQDSESMFALICLARLSISGKSRPVDLRM